MTYNRLHPSLISLHIMYQLLRWLGVCASIPSIKLFLRSQLSSGRVGYLARDQQLCQWRPSRSLRFPHKASCILQLIVHFLLSSEVPWFGIWVWIQCGSIRISQHLVDGKELRDGGSRPAWALTYIKGRNYEGIYDARTAFSGHLINFWAFMPNWDLYLVPKSRN